MKEFGREKLRLKNILVGKSLLAANSLVFMVAIMSITSPTGDHGIFGGDLETGNRLTQKIYPLLSKHSITYLSLTNFRLFKYDKSYDFLSTQIKSYSMVKVKCEVGLSTVNEQN